MTRLRHFDDLATARFVTFSCYQGHPVLADDTAARLLVTELAAMREKHRVQILGYVLMPEHVHLVLYPPEGLRLGVAIGQMKAKASISILKNWAGKGLAAPRQLVVSSDGVRKHRIWQKRCYDHNCRSLDTVREKIEYCHKNPVRRGLVSLPEDWPWSSSRWYAGERNVPLKIDDIPPP
jgi:putative transposase